MFRCTYTTCSSTFSTSTNLSRHLKEHTGMKPYACKICSKQFGRSFSLRRHMVTHTGEKNYECKFPYCNKRFNTSGNLSRHKRTHLVNKKIPNSPDLIMESFCSPTEAIKYTNDDNTLEMRYFPELINMLDSDAKAINDDQSHNQSLFKLNCSDIEPIEFNRCKEPSELLSPCIAPQRSQCTTFDYATEMNLPSSLSFIKGKYFDDQFASILADAEDFQECITTICDRMLCCIDMLWNDDTDLQSLSNDAYESTVLQVERDAQQFNNCCNVAYFGSSNTKASSISKYLQSVLHDRLDSSSHLLRLLKIINMNVMKILKGLPSINIVDSLVTHLVLAKAEAKNYCYLHQQVFSVHNQNLQDE